MTQPLSSYEIQILAELEEAGEENVVAIANQSAARNGRFGEIAALAKAIVALLHRGSVQLAKTRDPLSLHWIPLPHDDALQLCKGLPGSILWAAKDSRWTWTSTDALPCI